MTDTTTTYPRDPHEPQAAPQGFNMGATLHPQQGAFPVPVEAPGAPPEAVEDEASEKIDLSEVSESLNGFDQIAIRKAFGERFDELAEDPTMFPRALYFVWLRRQAEAQGPKADRAAYETAMLVPFGQLTDLFETGVTDDDEKWGEPSAVEERDKDFADFIVGTGLKYTLDEYMALTIQQRAKIIEATNRSR